jgi:hypothetical protein
MLWYPKERFQWMMQQYRSGGADLEKSGSVKILLYGSGFPPSTTIANLLIYYNIEFSPEASLRPLINLKANSGAYGTAEVLDFVTTQYPSLWVYPPSTLLALANDLRGFISKRKAIERIRSHMVEDQGHSKFFSSPITEDYMTE